MSDMTGTKAQALDRFCAARGQAFLRFDYFGHGASSGAFKDATVGRWKADALAVLDDLTEGPQVLVGSSLGGWIMLLAALARPQRVRALVGIAAAPDATEDLMWAELGTEQRAALLRDGFLRLPSEYDPAGYIYTRALIEEGRQHLVMRTLIPLACPVRLLHGMRDPDVPWTDGSAWRHRIDSHPAASEPRTCRRSGTACRSSRTRQETASADRARGRRRTIQIAARIAECALRDR